MGFPFNEDEIKDFLRKFYKAYKEVIEEEHPFVIPSEVTIEAKPLKIIVKLFKIQNADEEEENKLNELLNEGYIINRVIPLNDKAILILHKYVEEGGLGD